MMMLILYCILIISIFSYTIQEFDYWIGVDWRFQYGVYKKQNVLASKPDDFDDITDNNVFDERLYPSSRSGMLTISMDEYSVYFFGGYGVKENVNDEAKFSLINDLWEYNPGLNQFRLVHDWHPDCERGVYGVIGNFSKSNKPGGRAGSVGFRASDTRFIMFGGIGRNNQSQWAAADYCSPGVGGGGGGNFLNDLWEYDSTTNEQDEAVGWRFIHGEANLDPTYMINIGNYPPEKNVAYHNALPAGRSFSTGIFIKPLENEEIRFVIFGGYGIQETYPNSFGLFNDIWMYYYDVNEFSWLGGKRYWSSSHGDGSTIDNSYQVPLYPSFGGVRGYPSGRFQAVGFAPFNHIVRIFGGFGFGEYRTEAGGYNLGCLNDLWEFNYTSLNFTLIGGSTNPTFQNEHHYRNSVNGSEYLLHRFGTKVFHLEGNEYLFVGGIFTKHLACEDLLNNINFVYVSHIYKFLYDIGYDNDADFIYLNDAWIYDAQSNSISCVYNCHISSNQYGSISAFDRRMGGRVFSSSFKSGESLYFYGGMGCSNRQCNGYLADIWTLEIKYSYDHNDGEYYGNDSFIVMLWIFGLTSPFIVISLCITCYLDLWSLGFKIKKREKKQRSKNNDRCHKLWSYLKTLIYIIIFELKDALILFFAASLFIKEEITLHSFELTSAKINYQLSQDQKCEIRGDFVQREAYLPEPFFLKIMHIGICCSMIVLVMLIDCIALIRYIGKKHFHSVFQVTFFIGVFRETLFDRILLSFCYIFFILYAFWAFVNTGILPPPIGGGDWSGYMKEIFLYLIEFVFIELLLYEKLISILRYNGSSCYLYIRRLRQLAKDYELHLFPDVELPLLYVSFLDFDDFISKLVNTTRFIKTNIHKYETGKEIKTFLTNPRDKISKLRYFTNYSHYNWRFLNQLTNEEINNLYDFFFNAAQLVNIKEESNEDVLFYHPILTRKWIESLKVALYLKKKKSMFFMSVSELEQEALIERAAILEQMSLMKQAEKKGRFSFTAVNAEKVEEIEDEYYKREKLGSKEYPPTVGKLQSKEEDMEDDEDKYKEDN